MYIYIYIYITLKNKASYQELNNMQNIYMYVYAIEQLTIWGVSFYDANVTASIFVIWTTIVLKINITPCPPWYTLHYLAGSVLGEPAR